MKISIIIPTYNRKDIVRILLQSLREDSASHAAADLEIIIVDDQSVDGTWEMLGVEFPEIQVLRGPGKNAEAAKRAAVEVATGEYIVVLDDDCIPRSGWVAAALPALLRGEKLVQSKIIFVDHGQQELRDESQKHWRVGFRWNEVPEAVLNGGYREQYIPICHEFGLFVAREVLVREPLDDINLLFDHQGEAASFYLRVHRLGYQVFFEPACIIDHLGSLHGGCKERDGKQAPKKNCTEYTKGMVQNRMILARMHNPLKLIILVPYYLAGGFYLSLKQRKPCYRYFVRGLREGITKKFVRPIPYKNLVASSTEGAVAN